jgi:hypothetical protein
MENNKNLNLNRIQRAYAFLLLAYLATLPIANTTALRNLLLLGLLVLLLVFMFRDSSKPAHSAKDFLGKAYWPLWGWFAFLCLFPLWAQQPQVAWSNLGAQWATSIMAWVLGLGGAWMLGRRGPGLWALAGASAFLVALHLLLTLMAWAGLFGGPLPSDLPVRAMWRTMVEILDTQSVVSWSWQSFPWGFRGFDPMHGNLGYTATQAVVLLLVCLLWAWREQRPKMMAWSALGVFLCFFSVAVAYSRGSVAYQLLMLLLGLAVFIFKLRRRRAADTQHPGWGRFRLPLFLLALLMVLTLFLTQYMRKDVRWGLMSDKVKVAFLVEDPVEFMCEGMSPELGTRIRERLASQDPQYIAMLLDGLNGDGGRIMLMRVGWQLALEQVRGLDGSRDSYRKLMEARCGHPPAMLFFHAHQGWLDTVLALGWGGGLLWAFLLSYLAWTGWRALDDEKRWPWALALFLMAVFWALRGLADSVYREHNLQMQAVLLAYLFGRLRLESGTR